jgi:lipopolysaccharide/colanic/teichoic acid biosynthesis glycosyltransferase
VIDNRKKGSISYKRLTVRPGITCIWQINGRNDVDFEEWLFTPIAKARHIIYKMFHLSESIGRGII